MEIQIFSNSKFGQLRVALNENGKTVFCLADVCKDLGIGNASDVKKRLDSSNLHFAEVYTKWSLLYVAVPCIFGNRTVEKMLKTLLV